jgi:hypothetical protein
MQSDRSIVPFILRPLRAHSAPQLAQVPTETLKEMPKMLY